MANRNNQTAGQAAQAQAATPAPQAPAQPAGPTGTSTAAAADASSDPEDADADPEEDALHADLRDQVRQLTKALGVATQEKAELQQQLTDERQRSGDLAGELNESEKLVEELQAQLKRADLRQAQSDAVIVSDGEHDYKVLAPKFKWEHVTYEAAELKDDEALVKRLVEAGVGFLHKIEAGE